MHLSDAEDLVYRRLLDLYYITEKELPLDTSAIARKIRMDLDIVEAVLDEFFEKTEKGYFHARCNNEIARHQDQAALARKNGQLGGRPANDKKTRDARFDEFWAVWPTSKRKVGKAAVRQRWMTKNLDEIADKIIADVKAKRETEPWKTGFEPAPATYINQRRWEDDGAPAPVGRMAI